MQYEELHRRYGTHVSQRIRRELTPSEFNRVMLDALPVWLEARAEAAHETYLQMQKAASAESETQAVQLDAARHQWRAAEDLAYIVAIAEDVCVNAGIS